jgi:myo-inositol 2-dehydrogenase/D-chiro-inositol 1-dehydrogenase
MAQSVPLLRVGLAGTGYIAGVHATNIARNPKFRLSRVYSPSKEHRQSFADRFRSQAAESLEEIVEAPDIDVVVVASSTDTHSDIAIRTMRAGKPLYCEKPIDLDLRRAKATADALNKASAPVMYGFNRRFDPGYRAVWQDVQAGHIGRLQLLQMRSRGGQSPPTSHYIETSGGIIRDKGVHFFDLMRLITGDEPVDVFAIGSSLAHPFIGALGDYDTFAATLRLRSGAICHIDNTRTSKLGYDERIDAFGTAGMIEAVGVPRIQVRRTTGPRSSSDRFPENNLERVGNSFFDAMDAFAQLATGGAGHVPTIHDALAAQIISEAAVISAAEHRVVSIAEVEQSLN